MKFFLLINVEMPTIVGILTFMSRNNSILGLYMSLKNALFLDMSIFNLCSRLITSKPDVTGIITVALYLLSPFFSPFHDVNIFH